MQNVLPLAIIIFYDEERTMGSKFNPFNGDPKSVGRYFQIGKIAETTAAINKKTYNDALQLVKSGGAKLVDGCFGYSSSFYSTDLMGEFSIAFSDKTSFRFSFTKDRMVSCVCPKIECRKNPQMCCIHRTAALILLDNYIKENNPGDNTDRAAAEFLQLFRYDNTEINNEKNPIVSLMPKIQKKSGNYYDSTLEMRIMISAVGIGRYYVVRSISDLVNAKFEESVYPLGKKGEIDFSKQTFDDDSKELFKTLSDWLDDRNHRNNGSFSRYMYYERDMNSSVELYGERLDRIFNMFEGKHIMLDTRSIPLSVIQENPEVTLKLTTHYEDNAFVGVKISGEIPNLEYGAKGTYFISDSKFMKLTDEYAQILSAFDRNHSTEKASDQKNKIILTFGKRHMAELYQTILPILRRHFTVVESDDDAEDFVPVEATYKFYLDIVDNRSECRVEMLYGDKLLSIKDNMKRGYLKEDYRNAQYESTVLGTILKYFPLSHKNFDTFMSDDDPDKLYDILENGVNELLKYGDVVCTDRFQNIRFPKKVGVSVGVSIDSDLLNLDVISSDISPKELLEVIKSYKAKKRYHRLKSGEFVDIDTSVEELSQMIDTMHISPKEFVKGKMKLPLYRALYLDKMLEQNSEIYANRDTVYKKLIKSFKTVSDSDFEVPESLRKTMRGYQRYGYRWLRTIESVGFGGILADDMGLGKTLQTISVLLASKEEGKKGTSLIVSPASLIFNWAAEFEKFAPSIKVVVVTGTQSVREQLISKYSDYDAVVTSYDLLKRDIEFYDNCEFEYQIIDEAQYIKNHNTAASKSVKLIKSKHRFALTGTPIENRLSELWSIFDYLMPGFLYGYDTFKRDFETPIVKKSDETAAKRLKRMISPFILRRLKGDVLKDLPEKMEEDQYVKFDDKQRSLYDAKVVELKTMLAKESDESFSKSKIQILAMLTQLRQICCDPSLIFEDYNGGSAKLDTCMEIVKSAIEGEHRMLIFSQFTSMLEIIENELKNEGIEYYKITGETSKRKRAQLVDQFNTGTTPVFLVSLKAGGTGLNLIGADMVIHYDPWWNAAAQNQATDRTHRIGQTKKVTVYKLLAKGTIEERIQKLQSKKTDLAESMLNGETVSFSSLSKEDLLALIS